MMRFDQAYSNPPYQDKRNRPIFQHFQTLGSNIALRTMMIYMASRWWFGTSGLDGYRSAFLRSGRLVKVVHCGEGEVFEQVFPGTEINGGVSIVETNSEDNDCFNLVDNSSGVVVSVDNDDVIRPLDAGLHGLVGKILEAMRFNGLNPLWGRIHLNPYNLDGSKLLKLEPMFLDNVYGSAIGKFSGGDDRVLYFGTVGGSKAAKSGYYSILKPEKILKDFDCFKVGFSQMLLENGLRRFSHYKIMPRVVSGRSTVVLGGFNTVVEQENFHSYVSTGLFETLLRASLAARMKHIGCFIPDLGDYTNDNPLFKSDEELGVDHEYHGLDLEHRLYEFFGLGGDYEKI